MSSAVGTTLKALWAALHVLQYGLAISGLNGIQDAVTCADRPASSNALRIPGKDCIPMTPAQFGLVVSIFTLGGLIGSLGCDVVTRRFGRVGTLRWSAILNGIGSAVVGTGNSVGVLIVGRILIGLGSGLSTVTVPLYLSDIAPPSIKKSLGIMNQLFIVFGILSGQALSIPFGSSEGAKWRWVLSVGVGLGIVQLLGSVAVKEVAVAEEDDATGDEDEERPLLGSSSGKPLTLSQLLGSKDSKIRRGLLVVLVTQLVQQLCGISPVMYFSTSILKPVFPGNSRLIALIVLLFKIPPTILPAFIIDRLGPRPILLLSSILMSLFALLLALGINQASSPLSIAGILGFVVSFSFGLGPVTWVVMSDVMPAPARTAAGALGLGLNWTMNFVMGSIFLPLQLLLSHEDNKGHVQGQGNIFFLFCGLCALGFLGIRWSYKIYEQVA